jgi:tousled-like kinase
MSRPPSLEEKLELLEARFTQPLTFPTGGSRSHSGLPDHSNLSEHSFGFSSSNHGHHAANARITANSNSTLANALLLVNSNQERTMTSPMSANSSLQIVHKAAAKHMQKVATRPSVTSPSAHSNSSSQQTLVTGHGQHGRRQPRQQQQRVVAESPPMLISPHHGSAGGLTNKTATAASPANPVTVEKPRVARTILANPTNAITNGNAVSGTIARISCPHMTRHVFGSLTLLISFSVQKRKSQPKRKVSSIQDATDQQVESAVTDATGTVGPPAGATNSVMASPTKAKNAKRARTVIDSKDNSASRSPTKHIMSENSRSNPSRTSNKKTTASTNAPPANNKSIHDFFTTLSGKKMIKMTGIAAVTKADAKAVVQKGKSSMPAASAPNTTASTIDTPFAVDWEAQCQKLQQQLQDKEEQLKAVTNNKTILHTALQAALSKTKQELQDFQKRTEQQQSRTDLVLEELLRWRSLQHAKELREKLAADGGRLGKVLYKRAGMRAVESWEDGYATKDLQRKKEDWKRRMRVLLERQEAYQQKQKAREKEKTQMSALQQLETQEEEEAIEMHMEALKQEESDLVAADQVLNDEKAAHIRALKRVESEDYSRFSDRPKLHDRYVLDELLGKGGFSEVWRGFDLKELREVAVKIHQLDPRWPDSKKDNYTKHVTREYEIHRDVRHPRIVSLYDVFEIDANSFATVLECCKGSDLDTLLKSKKELPERQARAILLQILSGMQYLSQPDGSRQGIIHYDLKPGNILFDKVGDAKITDFGLSKIVDAESSADSMELTSQGAGTYWYLPPECFLTGEHVRISNKVDVWSIGVIFYQMLYGRRPFGEGQSQDKILANCTMLNAQQVHIPDKPEVSNAGKDFLRQCLTYDQAFRPTIAKLCENPYVTKGGMK